MMTDEEIKDKLRKMLFLTQRANECGLSNNDFKEDIDTLSGALGLLDKKDKVIDLMAERLAEGNKIITKKGYIEYFYKKVEEE